MGTFHQDKSQLHGITVVVDTNHTEVYVGRCDDIDEREVVLLDADRYRDGEEPGSREEYLEKAARFGVWKKYDRVVIPRSQVISVQKLGEL